MNHKNIGTLSNRGCIFLDLELVFMEEIRKIKFAPENSWPCKKYLFFFETFLFALNILNQNKIEWSFTKIKIEKSLIKRSIQLFVYPPLKLNNQTNIPGKLYQTLHKCRKHWKTCVSTKVTQKITTQTLRLDLKTQNLRTCFYANTQRLDFWRNWS